MNVCPISVRPSCAAFALIDNPAPKRRVVAAARLTKVRRDMDGRLLVSLFICGFLFCLFDSKLIPSRAARHHARLRKDPDRVKVLYRPHTVGGMMKMPWHLN